MAARREGGWQVAGGPAIAAAAFVFYLVTLAPGLLWGDSAKFQRMAWLGELRFDETGHPIWVMLAHALTRIPWLDPAGACNLLSAALSALALWPAFRVMRRFGASASSSTLACLALAVSHTWWLHAVIAEVYALNSLVMLLMLDVVTSSAAGGGEAAGRPGPWRWGLIGLCFGLASGNHLMVALWLPGFLWWMRAARRAGRLKTSGIVMAAAGLVAGALPFVFLGAGLPRPDPFPRLVARLVRQLLVPESPGRDALQFAGYLLYQFPIPLVLVAAVAGAARLRRQRKDDLIGLAILYLASAAFAFSYRVPDRFAFFLPSYLVIALAAAPGFDRLLARGERRARPPLVPAAFATAAAALACVLAPPLVYDIAPALIGPSLMERFPTARALPGRDALRFHMYPGKRGYDGARRFCVDALRPLPERSVVIADYTLDEPLNYMQVAEGLRPDVEVYWVSPARQPQVALDLTRQSRHVYIAARDGLYAVETLSSRFDIRPAGPIYELVPR